MTATIIDGKKIALGLKKQIAEAIKLAQDEHKPCLAVILIGNDPASSVYVKNKQLACQEVGLQSLNYNLSEKVEQTELVSLIEKLNGDSKVNGILVQLPLPKHIDTAVVLETIDPEKDVDGFHAYNLGRLAQRRPLLRPCTPAGIMYLLHHLNISTKGKHAVVVGASNIVGRPMALELLMASATVTICHSSTVDLQSHIKQADILISAVGKPGIIQGAWIKPGSVLFDVGITRLADGSLTGDIQFTEARALAAYITPVPGGVGPMTVAMLLQNTLQAAALKSY